LALTLPRDEAAVHHENVSRVRLSGVSIPGPIYIYPTPQNVGVFARVTRKANCLISSTVKVRQNVLSGKHVVLSWKLHILTELRICPGKVWACHRYKISWAADNATVTSMEIQGRILVTIALVEARVGLHWSKARCCIPEIVGAQNFLSVVSFGQIRSTLFHVTNHLTCSVVEPPHRCLEKRPEGVHRKRQVPADWCTR